MREKKKKACYALSVETYILIEAKLGQAHNGS